jgi:hypothetical protein
MRDIRAGDLTCIQENHLNCFSFFISMSSTYMYNVIEGYYIFISLTMCGVEVENLGGHLEVVR